MERPIPAHLTKHQQIGSRVDGTVQITGDAGNPIFLRAPVGRADSRHRGDVGWNHLPVDYVRHRTPTSSTFFAYSRLRSRSVRCCSLRAAFSSADWSPAPPITIGPR